MALDYRFNHTMLRVRDPEASLAFYRDVLGMTLLKRSDFEAGKFSLYFLGYAAEGTNPFTVPGVVELTHNWGTEDKADTPYHHGNSEPRGFGHICITVPDLDAACARFDELGVEFVKRPEDGAMRGLAFIADPDGYWVEVIPHGSANA